MTDVTRDLVDALKRFTSSNHLALCTDPENCKYAQGARALYAYQKVVEVRQPALVEVVREDGSVIHYEVPREPTGER